MASPNNPKGAKSDKLWRDALMRAVKREVDKGGKTKRLEVLADKLVEEGMAGNVAAIKEIGDRLDGRPAQAVEMSGTLDIAARLMEVISERSPGYLPDPE